VKPTSRKGLLELINDERAELGSRPMEEVELSAAVDQNKRLEFRQFGKRALKCRDSLAKFAAMAWPGPAPKTTTLHVLEVRRAMAFREVMQLDQRIHAERTGQPLPWQPTQARTPNSREVES